MAFDLINKPWLPVVDLNGQPHEVGIADLLVDAHRLRRIAGETPTMTAALYRLVLAFTHRVFGPADRSAWQRLWTADAFDSEPIDKYVSEWPGRFDLFHPTLPFMQCPALASKLETGKGTSTASLVMYRAAGSNRTLFDHTTAEQRPMLKPAEAARWLVTVLAYDTGGTKTPYRNVKSSERAPGNLFGCVLVEGVTLKETLLLNLLVYDPDYGLPVGTSHKDRPVWEAEPPDPEPDERPPLGWTDTLTWPSRRVLLRHREDAGDTVVDQVVISPGTGLRTGVAKQVQLDRAEQMAAYQRRPASGKKTKKGSRGSERGPLLPIVLDQRRGVWRHAQELLLAAGEAGMRRRPTAVEQIAELAELGHVRDDAVYTLRIFGQKLGDKPGSVHSWHEEVVPVPVALLRASLPQAEAPIGHAVWLADEVGMALRDLEANYLRTFGDKPPVTVDLWYWPRLPVPFSRFLRKLASEIRTGLPPRSAEAWRDEVIEAARQAARRWTDATPRRGRYLLIAAEHIDRFERKVSWLRNRFDRELVRDLAATDEEVAV